jgi:hypothetical protein
LVDVFGHTAIYDALVTAYQIMVSQAAADPGRIQSIVLLAISKPGLQLFLGGGDHAPGPRRFHRPSPPSPAA